MLQILRIVIENIGKRFERSWVFRQLDAELQSTQACALVGANGSGKSTLLQIIAASLSPTTGKVQYFLDNQPLDADNIYRYLSIATPYQELVEEFSLEELYHFQAAFKAFIPDMNLNQFRERTRLPKTGKKAIKYFSSGMKQRVKLGLAFFSDTPLLLLDEPTSNLDAQGIAWYQTEIQAQIKKRLVIIGSNQSYEYECCPRQIDLMAYKKPRNASNKQT